MENSKKKHKNAKSKYMPISRLRITISMLLMSVMISITLYGWSIRYALPIENFPFPYWTYRTAIDSSRLFWHAPLLALVLAIIQIIIWRKRHNISLWLVILTMFFGCAVSQFTGSTFFFTILGRQNHHDTLETEHYIYQLSSEWKIGVGSASAATYLVWRCEDQFSPCDIVASHRVPPIFPKADDESTVADLQLDPQTGEILFLLNGEVIAVVTEQG